jgi:hypothetical protein
MSHLFNTSFAFVVRTFRLSSFVTAPLAVITYFLVGFDAVEFAIQLGFGLGAIITAVMMLVEFRRLWVASHAFDLAVEQAYGFLSPVNCNRAIELAIPLLVALDSVDFGTKSRTESYNAVHIDNVHYQTRQLRSIGRGW